MTHSSSTSTPTSTSTPPPSAEPIVCFGIDVAKDKLDLGRSDSRAVVTFSNDAPGIRQMLQHLAKLPAASLGTIVIEATGGYEQLALDALLDGGLPVARVNPGRVRSMAHALGKLAKTDPIDAGVLAHFARLIQPRLAEKQAAARVELHALVTCRRQLLLVRTEQTNRRAITSSKTALKSIDAVLHSINKQVDVLDRKIRQLIDSDDDMRDAHKLLTSVPGVGPVLSAVLLSELPELGTTDRRKVAALAGVAPMADDSGDRSGKRSIRGGRATVRNGLYMATLSASRFNPVIHAFYLRLKAKNYANKYILTACMRKLLTLLNAMLRDNLPWNQLAVVLNATPIGGGAK
jgi:transposase